MKLLFSLLSAFILLFQTPDLQSVRESYTQANQSKENSDKFAKIVKKAPSSDIVFKGYQSASEIISAKFMKGNERKTTISNGVKSLESNIQANPNHVELRLIRLSVQENLPKIVGYHKNLNQDKTFILKNFGKQNSSLKNYIKDFAKVSKTMTAEEKASLK